MMTVKRLLAVATLSLAASSPSIAAIGDVPSGTYKLDDTHAYVNFSYLHLGFSRPIVGFNDFDVTLELNQDDVTASALNVDIDPSSIDSQVEDFNGHLRGDKFFNVEKFDAISFVATDITMTGDNTMDITGDLTVKGITKSVTLNGTVNKAANHPMRKTPTIGVSASGMLMRSDFDLGLYAPAVGDEVTLNIQVELVHAGE